MIGSNATADRIAGPLQVYLAARSEDRYAMRDLRRALAGQGIGCTARWLDQEDLGPEHFSADRAMQCLEDILEAHVFVLYSVAATHRHTTGGKHVESGFALAAQRPFVLIGAIENVFHHHPSVHVVGPHPHASHLARVITAAAEHGTPIPREVLASV